MTMTNYDYEYDYESGQFTDSPIHRFTG